VSIQKLKAVHAAAHPGKVAKVGQQPMEEEAVEDAEG
jgi:hypothetical protein